MQIWEDLITLFTLLDFMHILKVVLILKLFLEVLLHHGERGVRCAAGELLVVYKLSLGLKELVAVLAAILALLWKTKWLVRLHQFSVIQESG